MIDRALLDTVRDAIFLADPETGMIVDANPAAEALCGRDLVELRSLHHTQLHPPEFALRARDGFNRHTHNPGLTEGHVLHKDGHPIPVEVSSSHFTTSAGRRLLVGIFRDTTERHEAREALRRSEERFRQVAESAGEFIWEVDANGLYIYANPVVESILGYTPAEVVGRLHFYDFFVSENREEMTAATFDVFARRQPFQAFLNWNVRKDGKIVALETSGVPVLDAAGVLLGYRGADTDVTERKQAEEALKASEAKYRALVETTGTGYHICNGDGKILDANREYVRLTGHTELAEILGRSVLEWTAPHDRQKNADAVARCARDGFVRDFVTDYIDGNHRITPIEINATVIGSGESLRIVALCRDITGRIRAEEAVRESERRLNELARQSRTTIWETDTQGLFTYVSPVSETTWGYRPDEVVGRMHFYDLHPEPGRHAFNMAVSAVTAQKLPFRDVVHAVQTKAAGLAWGTTSGIPMLNADGTLRGYQGSCTDITERKQTEDKLVTIMKAVESTRDAVAIADASGRHYYQNAAFSNLFGYPTAEELEAAGSARAVIQDPQVASALYQVVTSGNSWAGELEMVTESGRVFPAYQRADAIKDSQGRIIGFIAIITDISERKRAEANLREKEHLLSQSQRIAHIGSWSFDLAAQTPFWTDETLRIFGISPDSFAPSIESLLGLLHPEDRPAMEEWIAATAAGHSAGSLEFRAVRPDGSVRILSGQGEIVLRNDTHTALMVGTVQDITERKRAEEERISLQLQLAQAQKMESIGRLVGGLAHDFSNLMSVIQLNADWALEELPGGDPLDEPLMEIRKAADRAVALTRQLMTFSRKQVLQIEVLNLNALVSESATLVRSLLRESIKLVFLPGAGLGLVKADRLQLGQIIMNLAVNSRDAMPNGGTLTIGTGGAELDEADALANPEAKPGPYVTLTVRDTGTGMDRETLARAFEPFFTTKDVEKGTGLGLSMVHGIVKQSGGFIQVHSEPGCGAEFRIYLPAVLEALDPVPAAVDEPGLRGVETILVVEDEPSLQEPVCRLLTLAGYQVIFGNDVEETLQIAVHHQGPLHLLLTDVVMPKMSGPQLAERLRPLYPQMKVLYMSGYPQPRQPGSALASEVDFIAKPFAKPTLLRRVRDVLEGREFPKE